MCHCHPTPDPPAPPPPTPTLHPPTHTHPAAGAVGGARPPAVAAVCQYYPTPKPPDPIPPTHPHRPLLQELWEAREHLLERLCVYSLHFRVRVVVAWDAMQGGWKPNTGG